MHLVAKVTGPVFVVLFMIHSCVRVRDRDRARDRRSWQVAARKLKKLAPLGRGRLTAPTGRRARREASERAVRRASRTLTPCRGTRSLRQAAVRDT